MKKKGFTLVEVVISMTIISMIFVFPRSLNYIHSNISSDIGCKNSLYEIENILSYGKAYCKLNKTYGKIEFDTKENEILFGKNSDKTIKKVILPKDIRLLNKNVTLKISDDGHIKNGLTINVQDKYDDIYTLTIGVGIDLISISKYEA